MVESRCTLVRGSIHQLAKCDLPGSKGKTYRIIVLFFYCFSFKWKTIDFWLYQFNLVVELRALIERTLNHPPNCLLMTTEKQTACRTTYLKKQNESGFIIFYGNRIYWIAVEFTATTGLEVSNCFSSLVLPVFEKYNEQELKFTTHIQIE